jgi:glycosyltransferase involved in cell wall biosynthesis
MSPKGAEYILSKNKFLPAKKVEVNPNSIRPAEEMSARPGQEIRDKYGIPGDACVFIFSGNLGVGHGLHFVADAIEALADYPGAYFVIGGSGTHFQYLEKRLAGRSAGNALLYSWLPREDFEQILATSDVGLVFLYRYTSPQFPSRLLSYLEYSKPVLCAVNKETDIGSIVEEAECGKSVLHGELDSFIEAVRFFSEHPEEHRIMGKKGRELLMDNYTVTHSYEIIMNHFRT